MKDPRDRVSEFRDSLSIVFFSNAGGENPNPIPLTRSDSSDPRWD